MATVYSNTQHPKLIKWSSVLAIITGVICFILYAEMDDGPRFIFHLASFLFIYGVMFMTPYFLRKYTVDEEADTVIDSLNKKYPIKISQLKTISYKENKKGKFRSLMLRDNGIRFMDIRTSKKNADRITAQLLKANPTIEVKHVNHL